MVKNENESSESYENTEMTTEDSKSESSDRDEQIETDDNCSLHEEDPNVIQEKIDEIEITENDVLSTKRDLLKAYLINLLLYKKLSDEEKEFSPIKETLLKLQVLIEKLYQIDDKISSIEDSESVDEERTLPDYIMKNKGKVARKRKKEERNPRVKNKRRAEELAKKGKLVHDKNYDAKKTKTNKF